MCQFTIHFVKDRHVRNDQRIKSNHTGKIGLWQGVLEREVRSFSALPVGGRYFVVIIVGGRFRQASSGDWSGEQGQNPK